MTLTTSAQYVRVKIRDIPRFMDVTRYGDGTATVFSLAPSLNLSSGSAFVPLNATAWTATGATFDASGFVTFSNVISANSAYRLTWVESTFSEDEIGLFITAGGTLNGAAIEAVIALMFDSLKCASWGASDGSTFSNTAAQQAAQQLYEKLIKEQQGEAIAAGGMNSWSVNQELY